MHINDSKPELGSRVDRHDSLELDKLVGIHLNLLWMIQEWMIFHLF